MASANTAVYAMKILHLNDILRLLSIWEFGILNVLQAEQLETADTAEVQLQNAKFYLQ